MGLLDPAMDPIRESSYESLDRFFTEMTALFPDAYSTSATTSATAKSGTPIRTSSSTCANTTSRTMPRGRVTSPSASRKLVAKCDKIAARSDKVLQPNTPKDAVIQSWRGQELLTQATRAKAIAAFSRPVIYRPSKHYAVDLTCP